MTDNPDQNPDDKANDAEPATWHVVQQTAGHCNIYSQAELPQVNDETKRWGPFPSRSAAMAKRVGLIRAGKCLPSRGYGWQDNVFNRGLIS